MTKMMKRKIYWMVRDQIARKIGGSVGFAVWDRVWDIRELIWQRVWVQVSGTLRRAL